MSVLVKKTRQDIKSVVVDAAKKAISNGTLTEADITDFIIESPSDRSHGDFAVNAAMAWAGVFRKSPLQIASAILDNIDITNTYIDRAEVAGPGFINFYLNNEYYADVVSEIIDKALYLHLIANLIFYITYKRSLHIFFLRFLCTNI